MIYTVNHKKRDILFFTITLANLNRFLYTVFQKKTSTHIIGYKLRSSLILTIFDIKIPHIIWHRMTA